MKKLFLFLMFVAGLVAAPTTPINNVIVQKNGTALTGVIQQNGSTAADSAGLTSGRVPFATTGGLLADSANLLFDGVSLSSLGYKAPLTTITYSATPNIATTSNLQTIALTGDAAFTASGYAAGQYVTVRVVCDGTNRTISFPATWVWVGSVAPTTLLASKVGLLSLVVFGTTEASVVASWASSL